MKDLKIAVSSLPYNDVILDELNLIEKSGADFLHLDIMNGSLTESSTFNYEKINEINKKSTLFLDCHLMINEPLKEIKKYILSGCNVITVHYEAFKNKSDLIKCLKLIKKHKCIAGISLYPNTKISEVSKFLEYADLVLLMSVEIGKYGQTFIPSTLKKIINLRKIFNGLIEVDGGVNLENISYIKKAGADIVVVGGTFYNAKNKSEIIKKLKAI